MVVVWWGMVVVRVKVEAEEAAVEVVAVEVSTAEMIVVFVVFVELVAHRLFGVGVVFVHLLCVAFLVVSVCSV